MADGLQTTSHERSFGTTFISDLDVDSIAHCAKYLSLQDVSNLAITCKHLRDVAYSDSIWLRFFREKWQQTLPPSLLKISGGARGAYLDRHAALQQFKFEDPQTACFYGHAKPFSDILLEKNDIYFSQGSLLQMIDIDSVLRGRDSLITCSDHKARITCLRSFALHETSLIRSEMHRAENIVVTSSSDHSIRLWWKGSCLRCFRGHNGPVSIISDKLLGDGSCKVLASGGEDGTVRLWSLSSSGKHGQRALRATLYGHEKLIKLISVAGHKTSLLISISRDSRVRVWDATASSALRSSCCVGTTSVPGPPINMKCHESLLYVACGSSVVAIDLRSMQKVINAAISQPTLYSFEIMPSKSLICTGGDGRAILWDIRRNQETKKLSPVAELDGHTGPVLFLHMDRFKIVTGSSMDCCVNIWETETGTQTNSFVCCSPIDGSTTFGCSALAVNGYRIVTASHGEDHGYLCLTDYTNASRPVMRNEDDRASKFWQPQFYCDSYNSDVDD